MHYKIIFLIITRKNDRYNYKVKELLSKFFDLYKNEVQYFFIENKPLANAQELIEEENHIYINESFYPSVYKNTFKALNYIEKNYDYDYVIKTNINIFWNINNLSKYLECIPLKNYAGGYINNVNILNKDCIIMSKDVGQLVSSNFASINIADNYIISNVIKLSGVELSDLEYYISEKTTH